ncbi:DNA-processing protein DprA [Cohnella faecalis]|uniref:DNA-processing protein DprA n=1 Tax=Cohnella faecalis TaxID=2315694 RepID=UPI001313DE65|nr:DNA-processing protein DprA [Cohnella faecalis]
MFVVADSIYSGSRGAEILTDTMERMRRHLIAMHECPGIGRALLSLIVQSGRLEEANEIREREWEDMGLKPHQVQSLLDGFRPERIEMRRRQREKGEMSVVTAFDAEYPPLLLETKDHPWVLYYRGRYELASRPSVAVVGTRVATAYGRHASEMLSAECAGCGLTVVSGMASGIDTSAHWGALEQPGGTIAVLATPVNKPYPYENKELYRKIGESGLLLSETPPDAVLKPYMFLERNRIIAGLALGTVVVEAAKGSGAFRTADRALAYGRDVFVVPGQITSPRSHEIMKWLRDGAKPVIDAEDIWGEYVSQLTELTSLPMSDLLSKSGTTPSPNLSADEASIYELLLDRPRSIDELSASSGMTFGLLHSVLLSLLIKRRIHQEPGFVYSVL